jgi:hypothetical protein
MARQEGEVVERHWKRGRGYALRFRAYGERRYVSLGFERDGWDRRRAEEELQNVLADVRRGLWVPPRRGTARDRDGGPEEREVPTLGRFAADLVASNEGQVSEATTRTRRWALAHVAPLLGDLRLDEIDVRCIDEFRDLKIKESEARARAIERGRPYRNDRGRVLRPLSPGSINKTINFLQWVLGIALEYKYVTENAAAGRRRRLPVRPAAPVHLDTATHIEALLEGAAAVDRAPLFEPCGREAIVATLVFAGPGRTSSAISPGGTWTWRAAASSSVARRLRRACGRSRCSLSSAMSSPPTRLPPQPRSPTIRSSRTASAGASTATISATGS